MVMVTVVHDREGIRVPGWVNSIDTFRRWLDEADLPAQTRVWWLCGEVWADMSKEQIFSHVLVKTRITRTLDLLAVEEKLGLYLTDGVLLSNFEADISGNPDGMFLSVATLQSDRVRLLEGKEGGFVEIQGSPDMVLEILSDSSEQKDDVDLRRAYWQAGVREYWLVDARRTPLRFDILRRTARGYVRASRQGDWVRSAVFGRSFRLPVRPGLAGHPDYLLEAQ